jgi:hypothetical protein
MTKPHPLNNINGVRFYPSTLQKLGGLDGINALADRLCAGEINLHAASIEYDISRDTLTNLLLALGREIPREIRLKTTMFTPKLTQDQIPGEIARLRQTLQGVTQRQETLNPELRQSNQHDAAKHLEISLDTYLQYETDQTVMPQTLWVSLLSLRPTRRVRYRPTRHKHNSTRTLKETDNA